MPRPDERQIMAALNRTVNAAEPNMDLNPAETVEMVTIRKDDLLTLREFALARGDDKPPVTLLGFIDLLDRSSVTLRGQEHTSVSFSRKIWDKIGQPRSVFIDIRDTPQSARSKES